MDDGVEQCCGVGDSRCVIVVIGAVGALVSGVGVGGVVVVGIWSSGVGGRTG